jgi:hypothetical protein
MTEPLDELAREYRDVRAPATVATRVRAEVRDRKAPRFGWVPIASTAALAAVLAGALPMLWQSTAVTPDTATRPSLSTLASLKVERPASVSPSLSDVKTVKAPRMPTRPRRVPPKEQTNIEIEFLEEKDHAHS